MKNLRYVLLMIFSITFSYSFSQKLKKSDRLIAVNIQSHVNYLSDDKLSGRVPGSEGEHIADEYIIAQFEKAGYKPMGDSSTWTQKFNISEGKEITPACSFSINGRKLKLHTEYFPFAFSASKNAEARATMELAENGMPWFIDLKDLLDGQESSRPIDTSGLITAKALKAADKGATALIIYNNSDINDLSFDRTDSTKTAGIPVIYITKSALESHLLKDTSTLDVKLSIELKDSVRRSANIIGFSDNGADSTVIATAHLDNERDVAGLIELARLLKMNPHKSSNYLFIVYSGEKKGNEGIKFFNAHPVINLQKVNYTLNLDTFEEKGLPAIKQSITAINALRIHETKTRP